MRNIAKINYYENINANLKGIKESIQQLLINTVNQTFQQNNAIQLDTILESFQESRKDIEEDTYNKFLDYITKLKTKYI